MCSTDLACVVGLVFWVVGVPHVVVWEALLGHAVGVSIGVDGGDGVELGLLND